MREGGGGGGLWNVKGFRCRHALQGFVVVVGGVVVVVVDDVSGNVIINVIEVVAGVGRAAVRNAASCVGVLVRPFFVVVVV